MNSADLEFHLFQCELCVSRHTSVTCFVCLQVGRIVKNTSKYIKSSVSLLFFVVVGFLCFCFVLFCFFIKLRMFLIKQACFFFLQENPPVLNKDKVEARSKFDSH